MVVRVLGQVISGTVTVEKTATALSVKASDVRMLVGDGTKALLRLTDGAADLTVTDAGATSGTVSGTVALINVKDVTLSGTLSATFDSAATTQVVVSGTNVVLAVAGQQLSAARVTFSTSGSTVNLRARGRRAQLRRRQRHPAGAGHRDQRQPDDGQRRCVRLHPGTVAMDIPSVSLAGTMLVRFNTTNGPQSGIPAELGVLERLRRPRRSPHPRRLTAWVAPAFPAKA